MISTVTSGYIYCIKDEQERRKLGYAVNVEERRDSLQTGNAERLTIEYRLYVKDTIKAEINIHSLFAADRIRADGEWFKIKDITLLKKIFKEIDTTEREEELLRSLGLR